MSAAPELLELVHRYIDDQIDAAAMSRLNELLARDPSAADAFARLTRFDALLGDVLRGTPETLTWPASPAVAFDESRVRRRLPLWVAGGVAACLALAIVWLLSGPRAASRPQVQSGRMLAGGEPVYIIPPGEPLDVAGDAPAVLRWDDGSQAELNPQSKGAIQDEAGVRRVVVLSQGSGSFRVAHGGGRFQVRTPVATVTALGTEFTVGLRSRRAPKAAEAKLVAVVSVQDGEVEVDAGGESYRVKAGPTRAFGDDGEQNNVDDGDQNNEGQNQGNGQGGQNQGNGQNGDNQQN